MPVLVDTNVLLDVLSADPAWGSSSRTAIEASLDAGVVVLNPIIYSELASRYDTIEALDDAVPPDVFQREALPWDAAFLAGQAHTAHRRRGGSRERTVPDFLIGAHATVRGYRLLTRDPRRYRKDYPRLDVITPQDVADV